MGEKSFKGKEMNLESDYESPLSHQSESEMIVCKEQEVNFKRLEPLSELKEQSALFPIYFRLSQDTYMKFVDGGEQVKSEDIAELSEKGISDFYVKIC